MTAAKLSNFIKSYKADLDGNYQPSSNSERPICPEHASEVWAIFAEIFDTKWTSKQPPTPTDGWIFVLADLTREQVGHGIMTLRDSRMIWPPGALEFRAMCLPTKRENAAMYLSPANLLEHKLSDDDRQKGRDHLKNLKASLCFTQ
jgi:hypothetical protein